MADDLGTAIAETSATGLILAAPETSGSSLSLMGGVTAFSASMANLMNAISNSPIVNSLTEPITAPIGNAISNYYQTSAYAATGVQPSAEILALSNAQSMEGSQINNLGITVGSGNDSDGMSFNNLGITVGAGNNSDGVPSFSAVAASTQPVAQAQSTATQMVAITQKQNAAQEKSDNSFLGNFLNNSKLAQNTGAATANAIGSSFANFVAEAKAGTLTVAEAFEQLGSSIGQAVVGAIGDTLIEMGAGDLTKGATAILKGNFAGSGGLLAAGAMESAAGGDNKGVRATLRFPLRISWSRIFGTTLAVRQDCFAEAK